MDVGISPIVVDNLEIVPVENIVNFLNTNCQCEDDAKYLLELVKLKQIQQQSLQDINLERNKDQELLTIHRNSLHEIRSCVDESKQTLAKLRTAFEERKVLLDKIKDQKSETEEFFSSLKRQTEQLEAVEKHRAQLSALKDFKQLIQSISSCYKISTTEAVMYYSQAVILYQQLPEDSSGSLLNYMYCEIDQWESTLIDSVKTNFLKVMSKLGWGANSLSLSTPNQMKEHEKELLIGERNELFLQLLGLQKPVNKLDNTTPKCPSDPHVGASGEVNIDEETLPPVSALLIVYKKKFFFHFYGDRKTNNIEKPEWYLTQVLKWVEETKDYLDQQLQPLLTKMWSNPNKNQTVSIKLLFVKGLLQFVKDKLKVDLGEIVHDEKLLCHYVDEILSFDKELLDVLSVENVDCCLYSPVQCLLLEENVFSKWLAMESNVVKERLDSLLSDPETCWKAELDSLEDSFRFIPKSVNIFLTLLDCISKRYFDLPSFHHRRRFFLSQLDLLDEFRTRLMQLKNREKHHPICEAFMGLLNSAYYLLDVLTQWSTNVSYSLLTAPTQTAAIFDLENNWNKTNRAQKVVDISAIHNNGPFDYQIENMGLFIEDCELILSTHLARHIKDRIPQYRSQKFWSKSRPKNLPDKEENEAKDKRVSPLASDMLFNFANELEALSTSINETSFRSVWQKTSRLVDDCLFTDLVLKTTFSPIGCSQLITDISQGLFAVIGQYTKRPSHFFPLLADVITLFSLTKGTCMLLKDHLTQIDTGKFDPNEMLVVCEDYKLIRLCTSSDILKVLSKLVD